MNDAQILAIAITVLAIFGGVLINNARLGDVNTRLGDVKEALRAEMRADKADIMNMFAELRRLIETNHDTTLRMLADIDQRVTRLEARS
ncbi:MAG TPA: hypothetical protein VKB79_31130 [Bryobacteraceae bacterium]|nr:hypothetical protein [Bryobacteraceae bacterium]